MNSTVGVVDERLCQRRTVLGLTQVVGIEEGALQHGMGAVRGDTCRLVDQCHADRIRTNWSGDDVGVGSGSGCRVEALDQVVDRNVGCVVLDLHETDYVGVDFYNRTDNLGLLPGELLRRVSTTTALIAVRSADRSGVVQRREVVQNVERRHRQITAHCGG